MSIKPPAAQPDVEDALRLAREASIVGFETAKDHDDCGICLDAVEEVAIDGCDHMLCGARFACSRIISQLHLPTTHCAVTSHQVEIFL